MHRDLHDAVLSAGISIPARPSLINYFNALRLQFGNAKAGFLPQAHQSHTKKRLQDVLRCLARSGKKLGGKLADPKSVLAERLARWLGKIVEVGRDQPGSDSIDGRSDDTSDEDCLGKSNRKPSTLLLPTTAQPGEIPHDAWVSAEQAESALGHNQANTLDDEPFELIDEDQRQEEEKLIGRHVNPTNIDYSCLCWSPVDGATESISAAEIGWPEATPTRSLSKSDFVCTMPNTVRGLNAAIENLYTEFQSDLQAAAAEEELLKNVKTLDPTQLEVYKYIADWSAERLQWRQALPTHSTSTPPKCRLLLLGTAGTGKTHTAKLAIAKARRTLGSFQSVLTVAFSGVAAANLGCFFRVDEQAIGANRQSLMV